MKNKKYTHGTPIGNRILIKPLDNSKSGDGTTVLDSGIIVIDDINFNIPKGIVVALGDNVNIDVECGDLIVYNESKVTKIDGLHLCSEEFVILNYGKIK